MEVFLGGTCNESTWRDKLIKLLDIDYFNPVVKDWTEKDQEIELEKRKTCDILLYVITPKMKGVYSIAELIDDSNKYPEKTVFLFLKKDGDDKFEEFQIKSLEMVKRMVRDNDAMVFDNIYEVADYLNSFA